MSEEHEEKTRKVKADKLTSADFENKVFELGKKGLTSEKIGEALRKEGIHPSDYGKKISKVLKEKNIYKSPDMKNMEDKLEKINAHVEKNKQDKKALREKTRIFAEVRRIKKYHSIPLK